MAKEGAPHATMVEAFVNRLQQLYPEPQATYSLGRKVTPPGLKPDVYIEHADGRRWVFEMVHHNRHAQHLLENHARYAEAGISDHWILWQNLQPQTQGTPSPDQGVMTTLVEKERRFTLTAPQRAILEMQDRDVRYLYAFTINPLKDIHSPETEFARTISTGVIIYRFEGWNGEKKAVASDIFVPMYYLEFTDNGPLQGPPPGVYDAAFDELGDLLGFDEPVMIPSEVAATLDNLPQIIAAHQQRVAKAIFKQHWIALSPEEREEIAEYLRDSEAENLRPPLEILTADDTSQAYSDPTKMWELLTYVQQLQVHVETSDMPEALKGFLLDCIDGRLLEDVAEAIEWQAGSEVLKQSRAEDSGKD
jgi:predicted house-cleaning noncanonical NTP pyrophosphatase (MazG superfamily)